MRRVRGHRSRRGRSSVVLAGAMLPCSMAFAQADLAWWNSVGGDPLDGHADAACQYVNDGQDTVVALADGGAIAYGQAFESAGGSFVVRYGSAGEVSWVRNVPTTTGFNPTTEMVRHGFGAVAVTGTVDNYEQGTGRDVWIAGFELGGAPRFFRLLQFDHGIDDIGPSLASTESGALFGVVQHSSGSTLYRLDQGGDVLWQRYFTGDWIDDLAANRQDAVVASVASSAGWRVIRLDAAGEIAWSTPIVSDPSRVEILRGIAVSPRGQVALAGTSCLSGTCEILVGSLHPDGAIDWLRRLPASSFGTGLLRDVAIDDHDRTIIAGNRSPSPGVGMPYIAGMSRDGEVAWLGDLSSPSATILRAESLSVGPGGVVAATGLAETAAGQEDYFAARFRSATGERISLSVHDSGMGRPDEACDVDVDSTTGRFVVSGDASRRTGDVWTLGFSATGELVWDAAEPPREPSTDRFGDQSGMGSWRSLVADEQGSVTLVGSGEANYSGKARVIRLDADGALVWATNFPAELDESAGLAAIAVTDDGATTAVGRDGGSLRSFIVVRLQPDGAVDWVRQPAGAIEGLGRSVVGWPSGAVVATGSIRPGGNDDVYTVAYRPDGTQLWSATIQDELGTGKDVVGHSDGGATILAEIRPFTSGFTRCLVVDYSDAGEERWRSPADDTATAARCVGLERDLTGNVYARGARANRPLVAKYGRDGTLHWEYLGDAAEFPTEASALTVTPSGDVYVVGTTYESSRGRAWAARLTPSGQLVWYWILDDPTVRTSRARDVALGSDGRLYAVASILIDSSPDTTFEVLALDVDGTLLDRESSAAFPAVRVSEAYALEATRGGRLVAAATTHALETSNDFLVASYLLPVLFADGFEAGHAAIWDQIVP